MRAPVEDPSQSAIDVIRFVLLKAREKKIFKPESMSDDFIEGMSKFLAKRRCPPKVLSFALKIISDETAYIKPFPTLKDLEPDLLGTRKNKRLRGYIPRFPIPKRFEGGAFEQLVDASKGLKNGEWERKRRYESGTKKPQWKIKR